MHRELKRCLLIGLLVAGCSSGTGAPNGPEAGRPDTPVPVPVPDAAVESEAGPSMGLDGPSTIPGCDEAVVGASYFIVNCNPGPNGTPVKRQKPTPYQSCQLY
jgi:hypothetical protein